jgi:hypothetical protein
VLECLRKTCHKLKENELNEEEEERKTLAFKHINKGLCDKEKYQKKHKVYKMLKEFQWTLTKKGFHIHIVWFSRSNNFQ